MVESFEDEQEITAPATEIENALGRTAVQLQILDSFTIHSQPMIDVGIFFTRMEGLNFSQLILIGPRHYRSQRQSKDRALGPAPGAPIGFAANQFSGLAREFHATASAISRNNPGPR